MNHSPHSPQAILVMPQLRVQNANAIGSPLTHGFPSITAFTGFMWALERKLSLAGVPLHLQGVGVICHRHQEQATQGFVRSFNLTRNPVNKDGGTAAIVEEGRTHLRITLVFSISEKRVPGAPARLVQDNAAQLKDWAAHAGDLAAQMRIAGGTLIPTDPVPGKRTKPWIDIVAPEAGEAAQQFRRWRRQWLPGFALVGRDALLAQRLAHLNKQAPGTGLLQAWLHASRFNFEPETPAEGSKGTPDGKLRWSDPLRPRGSGWVVPIPVGYVALSERQAEGSVGNARNQGTPLRFVESVHSLGEWVGPHRLDHLAQLLWHPESDLATGLFRCRSGYSPTADTVSLSDEPPAESSEDADTYVMD
ncbi:type I-F CRISPR-associated protein Csy2 [Diaphorobacter ruginosibacter]|uniref:Type I-F CRISPR-associated protein Csy2 n=1 Tax=Diaphorobacter ruginosibacter TaxID=1715720 RepID=A0A7G9RMU2_9BURK|nr:type I-F CRISPR-associated protein Csy2 [Diaphorobacter ruginosibacter]QNN56917.1 type I-F CRISPR-associated protein Csy2 [Diaphorobacter ruginosibacter]